MVGDEYLGQAMPNTGVRDLEERQRIMKDRILLIGKNLVDIKEDLNNEILELRKDIETLKQNIERIKSFLESVSAEFSNFARKEDVEILAKQAKMFQPLDFVRREELK